VTGDTRENLAARRGVSRRVYEPAEDSGLLAEAARRRVADRLPFSVRDRADGRSARSGLWQLPVGEVHIERARRQAHTAAFAVPDEAVRPGRRECASAAGRRERCEHPPACRVHAVPPGRSPGRASAESGMYDWCVM
jgi:hypothetical protein